MTPVARTKAEELLERISKLVNSDEVIDEFRLAALKRDAKESLKTDAFTGYMALGALSTIAWSDHEIDENHQRSINLSDIELSHRNYAVSLAAVLRFKQATEEAITASNMQPENLTALRLAQKYAVMAGEISIAVNLFNTLTERSNSDTENDFNAVHIAAILAKTKVSETELQQGQQIAFDVLRSHRKSPKSISTTVDDDPNEPSVLIEFEINTSFREAQAIHKEVGLRLCEELPDGGHPSVLMFSVVGIHA
ncbi:MAG: hypothetical protein C0406_10360 [Sideroxydans sp.]|nr:hypothetical protein [Sideroxydans sp.]